MIVYTDPRHWAKAALAAHEATADVPAVTVVPAVMPPRLIWLAFDGGSTQHLRERVFLRVNCITADPDDAMTLARTVEAVLFDSIDGQPVVAIERSTGPNLIVEHTHHLANSLYLLTCRPQEVP